MYLLTVDVHYHESSPKTRELKEVIVVKQVDILSSKNMSYLGNKLPADGDSMIEICLIFELKLLS